MIAVRTPRPQNPNSELTRIFLIEVHALSPEIDLLGRKSSESSFHPDHIYCIVF